MIKYIIAIYAILFTFDVSAQDFVPTHYVTHNLHVRTEPTTSSSVITTLPRFTAVQIIETGITETIGSITAPWVRLESQSGFAGWSFSGFINEIESEIAKELADEFAHRSAGSYPADQHRYPESRDVTSITAVQAGEGYYIQQWPRRFQGPGNAPEILQLTVERSIAYLREIDIVDGELIYRNEMILEFDGKTYSYEDNYLQQSGDAIHIYYRNNVPEDTWLGTWDYRLPYTFAGSTDLPVSDSVKQYTTDYLSRFAGTYDYDSHSILPVQNETLDVDRIRSARITVDYDQSMKSLLVRQHDLYRIYGGESRIRNWELSFIETQPGVPFFWSYGEGFGFSEVRFFFHKGGIAVTYESRGYQVDENREIIGHNIMKYVVFYRKSPR